MRWRRLAAALLALPLAGCFTAGELGNLHFELQLVEILYEYESGDRILLGSRVCPAVAGALRDDGTINTFWGQEKAAARACYDESVDGPASLDADGCLALDAPGEVTWTLTPDGSCEYGEDQLRFTIVLASPELRLGFDDWRARAPARLSSDQALIGLAPGRELDDLREDPAAPRLVVADSLDVPHMRLDDLDGRIFWTAPEVSLELVGEGLTVVEPIEDPDASIYESVSPGELALRLEPGGVARVRATLPDGELLESPELIGVASSTAASLDLMVLVDIDTGDPEYAFAEVRDADGRVLHGAPVEWSMQEGALLVLPGNLENEVRTAEYAMLGSICDPPSALPIQRRAVLRARLGALEDTVTLVWFDEPEIPELLDKTFVPSEECLFADDDGFDDDDAGSEAGDDTEQPSAEADDGCGCSSGDRGAPLFGLLALLGLGLLRRRPR